ncbi:hypothetical protein Dda_7277 [Drechslerella dactyloides]|uniref:C2H2-type domain-containing protein n=1 Tax=Drechslerella dactyloides TaxID=74499 RepID=A0AAD6ISA2_DREDA|nr:hypothetical protein Dda_7277 [Drechslerella dactyloides]
MFKCSDCPKEFPRKDNMIRHYKSSHGPRTFCHKCCKNYRVRAYDEHKCNRHKRFKHQVL